MDSRRLESGSERGVGEVIDPTIKDAWQGRFYPDDYKTIQILRDGLVEAEAGARRAEFWQDHDNIKSPSSDGFCHGCRTKNERLIDARHNWNLDDWRAEVRGELEMKDG